MTVVVVVLIFFLIFSPYNGVGQTYLILLEIILSTSSAAEDLKRRKYPQLVVDFEFFPVAVETSGIIGSAG